MALAVVQSVGVYGNNVSSITTGAISTTTGNLIHVDQAAYFGTGSVMVASDSVGNTFQTAVARHLDTNAFVYARADYAKNITGNASHTFTQTLTDGAGYGAIGVIEISGADTSAPLDLGETQTDAQGITNHSFTTSGTTAQAAEIAVGCIMSDDGGSAITEASGWTSQYDSYAGNLTRLHNATKILSATGTVTYNPTSSGVGGSALQICSYKQATGGGAISGDASITEASDTSSATGTLAIKGSVSATEASDSSSASATLKIVGTASLTEADDTLSAAGSAGPISGTASITEASDTSTATSTLATRGMVSVTEDSDTVTGTSALRIAGTASLTEDGDTTASTAVLPIGGAGSGMEASDTVSATGALKIAATATITEDSDTLSSFGASIGAGTGTANITEDSDTSSATATLKLNGAASIQEASDTCSAASVSRISGAGIIYEDNDTAAAAGFLVIRGGLAATEAGDTLSAAATSGGGEPLVIDPARFYSVYRRPTDYNVTLRPRSFNAG